MTKTETEIQLRIQDIVKKGDLNPTNSMFKHTHGHPTKGKSTRGYRQGFYAGFFQALKWVLEEK